MSQLLKLKAQIPNPSESNIDEILEFLLEVASDIICERRNSNVVETKFLTAQIRIALELYNKRGAEGQTSHNENGINRTYEVADVSHSLLSTIPPMVRTPHGVVRIVNEVVEDVVI